MTFSRKIGLHSKSNSFVTNTEKLLDLRTQSGAVRRNRRFFLRYLQQNMETVVSHCLTGKENTSGGIKVGENCQPEELSNARNGYSHGNNESQSFNDEKHSKILQNIVNKQQWKASQNIFALYISQDQKRVVNKWKKC